MTTYENRRRFSRIAFHRPAEIQAHGRRTPCELLDVSLKGGLVEVAEGADLAVGTACSLVIHLDDAEASIRMEGEIAHAKGRHVGIRCDEIDLESIAHLRRLVELNLGDDEILHRELGALVAERNW